MKSTQVTLLFCASLCGCAFFGKSEPLTPRYYTADVARPSGAPSASSAPRPELRLGAVLGGSHLRERIAYRTGPHELGFYEQRRWTERPEVYVRRALAQALYEQRGLVQVVSGLAPTLEVELISFDELQKPSHAVRIEARVTLLDGRSVRLARVFTAEQPVQGEADDFAKVPDAMSEALTRIVDEIAERVVAELPAKQASASAEAR